MGLLDEAIREHLELKRKHGARDVEVNELEQEAFGPALQTGELPASPQAAAADELATATAGGEQLAEPPPPPPPGTEERALPFAPEPVLPLDPASPEAEGFGPPAEPELESFEPPPEPEPPLDRMDESLAVITEGGMPQADFYDFEEEPAEVAEEPEAEFEEDEPPTYEQPEHGFEAAPFEAEVEDEVEFESPHGPAPLEGPPLHEPAPLEEPPLHEPAPFEEPAGPEEFAPLEPVEGEPGFYDVEGEDGDVLEETPEFLQDSPDDEELWFEQRPPKDFDL